MEIYNPQRDKSKIINYGPEELRTFELISYEWIDNLCFTVSPKECLSNSDEYVQIAKEIFLEAGWYGDGEIELMWIPPFAFAGNMSRDATEGITVWHVKQKEDGISWILHPQGMFNKVKKVD